MIETSQKDQKAEWNVPMMEATNRSNQKETSISSSPKPVFFASGADRSRLRRGNIRTLKILEPGATGIRTC